MGSSPIPGMFPLEPPAGGLERLRRAMRGNGQSRWQTVTPWAATACMLLLVGTPLLVDQLRVARASRRAAQQIVQSVRAQEPRPLQALPSSRGDVRVYLARPATVAQTPE